jgi:D-serine deaminase-like pyridoxal phosphate-dependent protein
VARQSSTPVRRDYRYYRDALDGQPMPYAFVDRDVLERNAAAVLERARSKLVRVASKSVRSVAVLRHILDLDERFQGLMCFTAEEATRLAALGFDDLLVAYPTWDSVAIDAVASAVGDGSRMTLMIDDVAHVDHLQGLAARRGLRLPVCIEMDASRDLPGLRFGTWRSPLREVDDVVALAARVDRSPHLHLDGLMIYEGQIAGVPDRAPGQGLKGPVIRALKGREVHRIAEQRAAVVRAIDDAGLELRFVNGGGTGSLESTAAERAVTEVTVGSGFYAPTLFDHYDAFRHEPAAGYAVQIVRRPAPGVYTCLGGGYTASGVPGPDKSPQVWLPDGAELTATEGAGEVQTPVRYDGAEDLGIGDPIFLRHAKAGELCERFLHLLIVSDGAVVDEVATYRGEGWCLL